jgi:hypothetical protein
MALLDMLTRKAKVKEGSNDDGKSPKSSISKTSDDDNNEKLDPNARIEEKGESVSEGSFVRTSVDDEEVQLVNGEPVITTGRDVSRYAVDLRDDEDPALTFRSLTLGTVFAGLGAALCQVRISMLIERMKRADVWNADLFI